MPAKAVSIRSVTCFSISAVDSAGAVVQFNDFLDDAPPAAELPKVAPLVQPAYEAAKVPLPAPFTTSPSTTTTTSVP